jgi:hypothetical protein
VLNNEPSSLDKMAGEKLDIYERLRRLREGAMCADAELARLCWQEIDILLDKLNTFEKRATDAPEHHRESTVAHHL